MSNQIIYVLASPSIPGMVKVGATSQATKPVAEDTDESPKDFRYVYIGKVSSSFQALSRFDDCFGRYKNDTRNGLYSITEKQAVSLLTLLALEEIDVDQFVLYHSEKLALSSKEAEVDIDGDERLLLGLLNNSLVDETALFDSCLREYDHGSEADWSATVLQWMKEDDARSVEYYSTYAEKDMNLEMDLDDSSFKDAQAREWEEKSGYFRDEAIGDRSTDDCDASDHEHYEDLVEAAEMRALAEEERDGDLAEAEYLHEYSVDADGFVTNPDGPSPEDDPENDDPYYSWEAEDYEEQKRPLHEE